MLAYLYYKLCSISKDQKLFQFQVYLYFFLRAYWDLKILCEFKHAKTNKQKKGILQQILCASRESNMKENLQGRIRLFF